MPVWPDVQGGWSGASVSVLPAESRPIQTTEFYTSKSEEAKMHGTTQTDLTSAVPGERPLCAQETTGCGGRFIESSRTATRVCAVRGGEVTGEESPETVLASSHSSHGSHRTESSCCHEQWQKKLPRGRERGRNPTPRSRVSEVQFGVNPPDIEKPRGPSKDLVLGEINPTSIALINLQKASKNPGFLGS